MSNPWLCVADAVIILMLLFGVICIMCNAIESHGWERFFSILAFVYGNAFIVYLVLKDFLGCI